MDTILLPLIQVINIALDLFIWALIISAILSWLVAFNIVNTSNQLVYSIGNFLHKITEPALRPIRSVIPSVSGIDLSPIALILAIYLVQGILSNIARKIAAGSLSGGF